MSMFSELDSDHCASELCKECKKNHWLHAKHVKAIDPDVNEISENYSAACCNGSCPLWKVVKLAGY